MRSPPRLSVPAVTLVVACSAFAAPARADATAVYACINGGSNQPQAANKETINAEVSAAGSFEPKNGRVVASLSAGPPPAGDFTCPPGQRLVLASVSYTAVVLTDTTSGVSTAVADASRTFLELSSWPTHQP